jgi:hypothetical protein
MVNLLIEIDKVTVAVGLLSRKLSHTHATATKSANSNPAKAGQVSPVAPFHFFTRSLFCLFTPLIFRTLSTMKKKAGTYAALVFFLFFMAGCAALEVVRDRMDSPVYERGRVVFYYDSTSARAVSVAGDFNGWEYRPEQPRAVIMKQNASGLWRAEADIPPGRYQYKIVVDYHTWITDPYNTNTVDDGTGNINSLLVVK